MGAHKSKLNPQAINELSEKTKCKLNLFFGFFVILRYIHTLKLFIIPGKAPAQSAISAELAELGPF